MTPRHRCFALMPESTPFATHSAIDLQAYLRRIRYDGSLRRDFDTLRALHRAHLRAIPYENFDVQLGRATTTDARAAFAKLVMRRRGGWCYEMNGAFGLALQALGFPVSRLAADGSTPHSHLVLTVALDGVTYVCDVGFADGPIEPYPLVAGAFTQDGFEFKVETLDREHWRLHNHKYGAAPGFSAGPPNEIGMSHACRWLQTSPESPFVQHVTVFRRVPGGFVSLIDRVLREVTPSGVNRTDIETVHDYIATLRDRFDLDLPEVAQLWPTLCARHEQYLRESAARKAAKAESAARK